MKSSRELMELFLPYIEMYGPNEAKTGIKGIRSDAPKESIEAFLLWYRDNHRYDSGRMMNPDDKRLQTLIIDITNSDEDEKDLEKEAQIISCRSCFSPA
ncbi:MAG: hypothetical protein IKC93_06460 [Candidatus Methanomethylophilaceae archaeon]|nr:hypothetical protein [Candidatus Methanomethylophilaceae archaeon]MBR7124486.1 hypothetical protein [Candidatus Methanomethylophilaceae archaeon]